MPLLEIGEERQTTIFETSEDPLMAVAACDTSSVAIFSFHDFPHPNTEVPMATPKTKTTRRKSSKKATAKKPSAKPDNVFADDDDGGDDDDAELQDGAGDLKAQIDQILDWMKAVQPLIDAMQGGGAPAPAEDEPVPAEFSDSEGDTNDDAQAALVGRLTVLEDKLNARDEADEVAEFCDSTLDELDSEGYEITANARSNLSSLLKNAKDRKSAAQTFASSIREGGRMKPAETLAEFEDGPGTAMNDLPEDIAEFAEEGDQAEVIRLFQEYEALSDQTKERMKNTTAAKYVARHLTRKEA